MGSAGSIGYANAAQLRTADSSPKPIWCQRRRPEGILHDVQVSTTLELVIYLKLKNLFFVLVLFFNNSFSTRIIQAF
jgi:hypothetical protein